MLAATVNNDKPDSVSLALGTDFAAGQRLDVQSGLAEITFNSGAKILLHSPAQFTVGEALGGDLQLGRLTARVPHSAIGFTVNTPGGKVVDLGTEFGVKVNFDRTMHVIVYVGEVAINASSGTGSGAAAPVTVKAGEAVVVSPGEPVRSTPPKDERFIRDIEPLVAKQNQAAEISYVGFMKTLGPAVWFRMEGKDADRVIKAEMGAVRDGKLSWIGQGNPFLKGPIGKCLWLRGPTVGDRVYVADYPKAEHGKLTVSAWALAETRPNQATMLANWREDFAAGQFQFGLFSHDDGDALDLVARISPGDGGPFVTVSEGKSHPFPLNTWQHVAFTTDGTTLRLYRQGQEVASVKHAGLKFPSPVRSLAIGCTFDKSDKKTGRLPGWWDGKLDELAIFNDTLSPEDTPFASWRPTGRSDSCGRSPDRATVWQNHPSRKTSPSPHECGG